MATEPLSSGTRIPSGDGVWRVQSPETRIPDSAVPPADGVDIVQALADLGADPQGLTEKGLADALLAWLSPRPRNPDTLTQSRIVPLLGAAADLLARSAQAAPDIVSLGSVALEQELRTHRTLADRRATLIAGDIE